MPELDAFIAIHKRMKREDPEGFRRMVEAKIPLMTCAMCRETIRCYGNNGNPLVDGDVCNDCNASVVAARFRAMTRREDA